jgi:hypothetical protein
LPHASHTTSSIPSLVDSQGLRPASISSTTDSSFHSSPASTRFAPSYQRWPNFRFLDPTALFGLATGLLSDFRGSQELLPLGFELTRYTLSN